MAILLVYNNKISKNYTYENMSVFSLTVHLRKRLSYSQLKHYTDKDVSKFSSSFEYVLKNKFKKN